MSRREARHLKKNIFVFNTHETSGNSSSIKELWENETSVEPWKVMVRDGIFITALGIEKITLDSFAKVVTKLASFLSVQPYNQVLYLQN